MDGEMDIEQLTTMTEKISTVSGRISAACCIVS
jgi:hypothetical protein